MQDQALPRYSVVPKPPPPYSTVSSSSALDHYSFSLKSSKGNIWASVNLPKKDHSGSYSVNDIPIIGEGANLITGLVKLNLKTPETIQRIIMTVRGRAITGANEGGSHIFLDHSVSLWSKEQGEPNAYRNDLTAVAGTSTSSRQGKLLGSYTFPFTFSLPTGEADGVALPDTFHERASGVRVRYELVLKIGRGRLKSDSKLHIPVVYHCRTAPSPPSILRQHAYQENTTAPGPPLDPDGWSTFSPVDCIGRLLNSRTVILRCTLSLANPLSYTRGSFISCHLRVESIDEQALDLLVSPRTTVLRLSRRVKYLFDAGQGMQHNGKSTASVPRYEILDVGQTIWSHDHDINEDDSRVRYLTGEIPLSKELPPSSDVSSFGVEYIVTLLPFESATFRPEGATMLQTHKVQVVSDFAQGPVPSRRVPISPIEATWAASARESVNAIAASHSNPFQLVT
ncbi:hypothetical protein DFH05DRAFT_1491925 [Lentinula detonsa]|uniref:Arrestin-like N-terminal domain-containing protein n=1 Tax=Lentinula detonsa TaxID=2804962 RepID=A0A9W8P1L2_9AGAR|nr:hypothetical protein DFH05DRAFT_1491925 [Lentinula detonsa]